MSIQAMTGLVPEWYTPEVEKDDANEESRASFHCFPLTQPQVLEVQQYYDSVKKDFIPTAYAVAYRLGCRGWKNVTDHEGKPLKWNPNNMDRIPAQILAEVGANIINISVMGADDEKN